MIDLGARKRSVRFLRFVLASYLGVMLVLMMLETMLVYPAPGANRGDWSPTDLDFEEVTFASDDGTALCGWYVEHPAARHAILLCHGNGENISYLANELAFVRERFQASVLTFDYRGYGKSEGKPHENGILADGVAAHAWLAERAQLPLDQVVVWGRSLGGGVGVHLAATHGVKALILDRTFNSMVDTAACHFPWLPIKLIMRNRYPSEQRIRDYDGPLFQVHGQDDNVIPFHLGRRLFDAAPSADKQFLTAADLGHNQIWPEAFYQELELFLSRLH